MMSLLSSGSPTELELVHESLREQLSSQGDSARMVIGSTAMQMRGQSFAPDDEDLYEGFAFVQYVCAAAGIPVAAPEDLTGRMMEKIEDPQLLVRGDIVSLKLERAEGVYTLLAIASDDGSVIYATPSNPWVLESDVGELGAQEIYRCSVETTEE